MREIERTTRFRCDYKREIKGRHGTTLEAALLAVLLALVTDQPLADRHRDHPLSGDWAGFRDCHIKPDLVLIYEKPDETTLRLVRLGSHSELGFLENRLVVVVDPDVERVVFHHSEDQSIAEHA